RTSDLGTATGTHFNCVHHGADWDVAQGKVVARLDVCTRTGFHLCALLEVLRSDDVALLSVCIVQQSDASRTVRVIFDVCDLRRNAIFVMAAEVDDTVLTLVTAALVAGGHASLAVAAAALGQRAQKRLL